MTSNWLIRPLGSTENSEDRFFDTPYGEFRDQLRDHDIVAHTYDMGQLAEAEKVVSFNHDSHFIRLCKKQGVTPDRLVLVSLEPQAVLPQQYGHRVLAQYSTVFIVRDDLVDDLKLFKTRYIQGQGIPRYVPEFTDRGYLSLINAHKYSYVRHELYSLRRQAIRHFEATDGFDLYGYGWGKPHRFTNRSDIREAARYGTIGRFVRDVADSKRPFPAFRGPVDDKYATLARYKYSLCFENEMSPGYITEKLFDCLVCGTVPVYLGAPNITDYVPEECFIDMRNFADFDDLDAFLRGQPQAMWDAFSRAGRDWVGGPAFHNWRPPRVYADMLRDLGVK